MANLMVIDTVASSLSVDMDRVRAFVRSEPSEVPEPAALLGLDRSAALRLWALLARKNLKRLLLAFARCAPYSAPDTPALHRSITQCLMALPEKERSRLLTEPEVTSWLAGVEGSTGWDGSANLTDLGRVILGACFSAGVDTAPLPISSGEDLRLPFRPLGWSLASRSGEGRLTGAVVNGRLEISLRGAQAILEQAESGPKAVAGPWLPMMKVLGGTVLAGLPDPWLQKSFPNKEDIADDGDRRYLEDLAQLLGEGHARLQDAWPAMAEEIELLLRWVVPMRRGESFFVPGFRGLVALPVKSSTGVMLNTVHELSHNKMSSLYDLVDVLTNPDELAFSPFAREKGPLASLIHSCWAFANELNTVRHLEEMQSPSDKTDWSHLKLKIRIFFDKGLKVLHQSAHLTPYGESLIGEIERQVYDQ